MSGGTSGASTISSHEVLSSARAVTSSAPCRRISSATGVGTRTRSAVSRRRSRCPPCARMMSGDASVTAASVTLELTRQILVHREDIHALSRKRCQERCPVEPGNLGGLFLRNLAPLVPMDCGSEAHLSNELLRRAPKRGEDFFGEVELDSHVTMVSRRRHLLPAGA